MGWRLSSALYGPFPVVSSFPTWNHPKSSSWQWSNADYRHFYVALHGLHTETILQYCIWIPSHPKSRGLIFQAISFIPYFSGGITRKTANGGPHLPSALLISSTERNRLEPSFYTTTDGQWKKSMDQYKHKAHLLPSNTAIGSCTVDLGDQIARVHSTISINTYEQIILPRL